MKKLLTDSRLTGLFYLGIAVTGMFSFLFARAKMYVPGEAMTTATNLIEMKNLALLGIASELALVAFQALAAIWFFKLFRKINDFAAGTLAVFGMVNAVAILISNAFWLSALVIAQRSNLPLTSEQANSIMMMFELHETTWLVSNLFFGLWLLPMGYLASKTKISNILAWILYAGGTGYVISAFWSIFFPASSIVDLLASPATVGEFWMIGYLLLKNPDHHQKKSK